MSKYILKFKKFNSNVSLDICGSKSISQRALIINHLSSKDIDCVNLSNSEDTSTLNKILNQKDSLIDVKDGGTTLRFFLCFLSIRNKNYFIDGSNMLKKRPIKKLILNLMKLGVRFKFQSKDYELPFFIQGGIIKSKDLIIDSVKTSQFASGLALVAPLINGGLRLILKNKIPSRPFFDMTIEMMRKCGAQIIFDDNLVEIKEGGYYKGYSKIESDWTSISYIYEVLAFSKNISVSCSSFFKNSIQGDSAVVSFFNLLGVETNFSNDKVILRKHENLPKPKLIEWDVSDTPDLALTYIVSCLGLGIDLKLTGIKTLYFKESNRLQAIAIELKKFNVKVVLEDDFFLMNTSSSRLNSCEIKTHSDHRIALAFSPLVIITKELIIDDSCVVSKSYPEFWNDLKKIGVKIISNS